MLPTTWGMPVILIDVHVSNGYFKGFGTLTLFVCVCVCVCLQPPPGMEQLSMAVAEIRGIAIMFKLHHEVGCGF
jgi:hypothetical protein